MFFEGGMCNELQTARDIRDSCHTGDMSDRSDSRKTVPMTGLHRGSWGHEALTKSWIVRKVRDS